MLEFGAQCPNLRRMIFVSTAYVFPPTQERVPQHTRPPLARGYESLAGLVGTNVPVNFEQQSEGYPNTYTWSKAFAENLIWDFRERMDREGRSVKFKLSIIRPSIISVARRYPYPGWTESMAAYMMVVAMLTLGTIKGFHYHRGELLNVVPVDHVALSVLNEIAFEFGPLMDVTLHKEFATGRITSDGDNGLPSANGHVEEGADRGDGCTIVRNAPVRAINCCATAEESVVLEPESFRVMFRYVAFALQWLGRPYVASCPAAEGACPGSGTRAVKKDFLSSCSTLMTELRKSWYISFWRCYRCGWWRKPAPWFAGRKQRNNCVFLGKGMYCVNAA
eukprot:scaffold3307_cov371-Prasinococcus_capsulatus_cf.AAC.7